MKKGKLSKLALYISQHPTETGLVHNALLLCKAAEVIEQILRELRVKEIQQDLAYYTSMDTFFKMLPAGVKDTEFCGRLSIMNISYMNILMKGKFCEIVYVMVGYRAKIVRAEKVYEYPTYL